jgi:hypothetical protein
MGRGEKMTHKRFANEIIGHVKDLGVLHYRGKNDSLTMVKVKPKDGFYKLRTKERTRKVRLSLFEIKDQFYLSDKRGSK